MNFHISRLGRLGFTVSMLVSISIIFLLIFTNASINLITGFIVINFVWMILIYVGRFHDIGSSGWWTLLALFTGGIGMIGLMVWSGEKEANKYGPFHPLPYLNYSISLENQGNR